MRHQPFVATLTAQAVYALGDPIVITCDIENTSAEAYQLLTWATPLEPALSGDCFVVERDGQRIAYDGRYVKRGDPPASAYTLIGPGERQSFSVDISEVYAIDQPGQYSVALNAVLFDAFMVTGNVKAGARKRQAHEAHILPPADVQFEVVAGAEPKSTSGQLARKAESQLAKNNAKTPNFNGGTATQQADTIIAHGNAQYFSALSASQLAAGPASTNALYQTWYGAFDQGRYDKVTSDYNKISNTLLNEQVTYDFTGQGHGSDTCQPGYFAFTYKGSRTVWLCSSYLSAAQIGTDCKFGTLVHEWSHAVDNTDDIEYGETACLALATSDPGKAVNNADSHEYFAEHLAQSDFGKSFTFITDRSTFGKDEIDTMPSPAMIDKAFYVLADGFWPDKLGITPGTLGNSPTVKPIITFSPAVPGMTVTVTSLEVEDASLPIAPQRFTWVCRLTFANSGGFPANAGETLTVNMTATLAGLSANAQILLIRDPNPWEVDGPTSWLSTDLRVFKIRDGDARFGATISGNANAYIKQVLANLNAGTAGETFDGLSTDETLELSQKVNGTAMFNFAIARVHYRGSTNISNVRTFFRLFPASTTSTEFDPGTTYRRATSGTDAIALLGLSGGGDLLTIPCFAEERVNSANTALTAQHDPANVRTLNGTGGEVFAYFGCWLDINQTQAQFPTHPSPASGPWGAGRKSIQQLVRNAHQCLVAEIAFDAAPIPTGISPAASDKLAQRNLSIIESPNPGYAASRRILGTFELRPAKGAEQLPDRQPDELLIEWGNLPQDSIASIYIPEVSASQIVALAGARYVNHGLTLLDNQTIQLQVGGISYVPLPAGAAFGLTGLLSVQLPDTIHKGELYTVVVRQVSDTFALPPVVIGIRDEGGREVSRQNAVDVIRWRRVVGSYQLTIPVRTKEVIVGPESRLLSVLRWILEAVPAGDRWYPVFSRYVALIGDRVGGLGGNPDDIKPSPDGSGGEGGGHHGQPPGHGHGHAHTHRYEGKISGLIYDCFGDFAGFLLDTCGKEREFCTREHQIEALARTAWRERMAITVVAHASHPHRPVTIILQRAPQPYQA
jgi:hypothetical protein